MTDAEILQKAIDSQQLNAAEFAAELGLYGAQPLYNVLGGKYGLSPKMKRKIVERFPDISYDFLNGQTSNVQTGGDYSTNMQNIHGKMKVSNMGNLSAEAELKFLRKEVERLNKLIDDYREKEKKYLDLLLKSKE